MSDVEQIAERATEAFRSRELNAVMDFYDSGAVVVTPDGTFEGQNAIREFVGIQLEAFPDLDLRVHNRLVVDSTVIEESTFTGTHDGPLPLPDGTTLPPTGRRVSQRVADVAVYENGRIVRQHLYYDRGEVLEQLELAVTAS